jgi:hypothetical protein
MFNAVSPAHVFKPNPFIAVIHNSSPNNASPENAAPIAQPNTHSGLGQGLYLNFWTKIEPVCHFFKLISAKGSVALRQSII